MTALQPTHGSIADVELGTVGAPGTGAVISQYVNEFTFSAQRDKSEVSAFKNTFKAYVAGMADLTLSFNGSADQNIDGQLFGLLILVTPSIQYIYYPEGIGNTGTPCYTGLGFLDKYEIKTATNSAFTFSATFQSNGTPSRTVQ